MAKIHEKVRELMKRNNWSQIQAAAELGVSQATVHRWLSGKAEPEGEHRDAINAAYDGVVEGNITSGSLLLPVGIVVKGEIQAGSWLDSTLIDETHDERRTLPVAADPRFPYAHQYGLEVKGDSMHREFAEGSFVICVEYHHSGLEKREGMIVHVERRRHGLREITLKALKRETDGWRLEPRSTNPIHQPLHIDDFSDGDVEVEIRGIVIGDYRRRTF